MKAIWSTFGAGCRSFAYWSSVSSSQMPPRFFLIAPSISWRPEMLRVKPPRFTSSNSFRSSVSITVRGRRVFRSSSMNSQNQPCRKLNCRKTRFMLTPAQRWQSRSPLR